MTPIKTGDSTSIVRGVRPSTPSLKGNHHRHDCLPKSVTSVTGYGSKGPGSHAPEVSDQHEPTDTNLAKQHHNYATAGLGSGNHGLKKELGL